MNKLLNERKIAQLKHDIENLVQGTSDILGICLEYLDCQKLIETKQTLENLKCEIDQRKKLIMDKIDSIALK